MNKLNSADKKLKIGTLTIDNPVLSAPMSGITDKPFRMIVEEFGCGLIFTEMISANALAYDNEKTKSMFSLKGEKGPIAVQIFGSCPKRMAACALAAEESGAAIIDINMGCPAPKVVKNMEGSALMKDLPLASSIIESVVKAVRVPVTVKMRKGWSEKSINAVELSLIAEACGAAAVTIHGRTREQFYTGDADWELIGLVKNRLRIPVIGNGDVKKPEDALEMMSKTGCDGVMIGRAGLGNPWLFKRTVETFKKLPLSLEPTFAEKISLAKRHLALAIQLKGESRAIREMRKHLAWYLKGIRDSAHIRESINKVETYIEIDHILNDYNEWLKSVDKI